MRTARLIFAVLVCVFAFVITGSNVTAGAQSLEETYNATLDAYNQTLNQLEACDQSFEGFQKFFKENRPKADAPKEDWDNWAKAYRFWVDIYTGCMRSLKKKADDLKAKLAELQKQLDTISAEPERKAPPPKGADDKKKKAQDLLKKGTTDLREWTLSVRLKIRAVNGMSREASDEVKKHGSGAVKIEVSFKFDF